jgi:hypothetical protein
MRNLRVVLLRVHKDLREMQGCKGRQALKESKVSRVPKDLQV